MAVKELLTSANLATPGSRIRLLREARGLKQTQLAEQMHTSQPAISQWESDKWLPSLQSQRLLAEALNTTRAFLFGDES